MVQVVFAPRPPHPSPGIHHFHPFHPPFVVFFFRRLGLFFFSFRDARLLIRRTQSQSSSFLLDGGHGAPPDPTKNRSVQEEDRKDGRDGNDADRLDGGHESQGHGRDSSSDSSDMDLDMGSERVGTLSSVLQEALAATANAAAVGKGRGYSSRRKA